MKFPPDGHPFYPPFCTPQNLEGSPLWFWLFVALVCIVAVLA